MDPTLTWLHLSDLHASERSDWDAGRVLRTLTGDLRILREERELRPDLLVFTGDAAFAGRSDELNSARGFFEHVRDPDSFEKPPVDELRRPAALSRARRMSRHEDPRARLLPP